MHIEVDREEDGRWIIEFFQDQAGVITFSPFMTKRKLVLAC